MTTLWLPPGAQPAPPARAMVPPPEDLRLPSGGILQYWRTVPFFDPETHAFVHTQRWWSSKAGMKVCATLETVAGRPWGPLLHVSLSYKHRDPTWEEIKAIRAAFYGDEVDVMMVLPVPADYVNIHTHCFQMWQTPEPWGLR